MSLRIWFVNVALAVLLFVVGMKSFEAWQKRPMFGNPPGETTSDWSEKPLEHKEIPPATEYEIVVKENLFFPDRSELVEEPDKTTSPETEAKVEGPQLQMLEQLAKLTHLYGVLITDDRRQGFIRGVSGGKPGSTGESEIKRVEVGDTIGRFKVKEIQEKSAVLAAGGHEWQIFLFDKDNPKSRTPVENETGPVVIGDASKPETGQEPQNAKEGEPSSGDALSRKTPTDQGGLAQKALPMPQKVMPNAPQQHALQPIRKDLLQSAPILRKKVKK